MKKNNVINFSDRYLSKIFREVLYKKDIIQDAQSYHIDFLLASAIVKAREADKYDIDIPKE